MRWEAMAAEGHTITVRPNEVKWSDMQDLPGWQAAVLSGDPTKEGPYVQRVKIPGNALVPLHSHPDTENITVLTGSFGIGQGDKGAVIQVHGVGPSGMTMIQPERNDVLRRP